VSGTSIRLLGAVEADVGGATVDLGGPRQRRLAAALALRAGRRVGIGEIIDAVWPDGDLPPKPNDTLYTYVHRLRRSLGDQATVETKEGTYRILLTDDDVDALLFERMVGERLSHDPACRIVELERALALWRGPALSGFEHEEWARPHAVRLTELRSLAVDDLAEARLAAGRCDEAIVELEAAAAQQPLRERTHRLLMTALHLAGRKAEALRAFQAYRRRLATDLGLAPGDAISNLERAIAADEVEPPELASKRPAINGYEIHELIGEGAFARIYRGVQPSVGRDVAIKQIRAELADRPEFIRRFEFEAQLVARLEHPNIVPLYDFWREPGSAYLVMRWVRGGSLERRLVDGRLPYGEAFRIVEQIASALLTAHRAGVIHRDVKPANILLDGIGNAYLTDFGVAVDAERPLATDGLLGSPAYAAPEQLLGDAVSPATDVHALATVLHELLTGAVPFGDSPTTAIMRERQLHEPLPAIEGGAIPVPAGIDAVIETATAKSAPDRYASVDALIDALRGLAGAAVEVTIPSPAADVEAITNPYRGLRSFDEADAVFFHGREALTTAVVERLGRRFQASFVALVGPSGSGKSSLVGAGVIPALRGGAISGSQDWFITTMVPGDDPFEQLSRALRRIATDDAPIDVAALLSGRESINDTLRTVLGEHGSDIVLVIDQFEELFTHVTDERHVTAFVDALRIAVSTPNSPLRLLITLRADYYDRPLRHGGFAELLTDATVVVPPLAPDELERAITAPAAQVSVRFEPGLVAELISDVGGQPAALPLLQYALTELFEQRSGVTLLRDRYRAMGHLAGAIAARAEHIYTGVDEEHQQAARRIMMRLVAIDDGADDARRRVHRSELGDDTATTDMIAAFGAARLLAFDRDAADRALTVEVAHEALLREWPRLRRWLSEDRAGLRIHRQLTAASRAWIDAGRDDGDLLRGLRLAATEGWAERNAEDLNVTERELLDTSVARRAVEAAEEAARKATLQRQNRKLRKLAMVAVTIALLAAIAGAVAVQQRARAADRAFDTETARLASSAAQLVSTNRRVALLLAAEAYRRDPSSETLGALQRVLTGTGSLLRYLGGASRYDAVTWVDDATLVAGSAGGLDVFSADGELVRHVDYPGIEYLAASADGRTVAAGTNDSVVILDPHSAEPNTAIPLLENVQALAFSPDGAELAVGTASGAVIVLDANTRKVQFRFVAHPELTVDDIGQPGLEVVVLPHIPQSDVRGVQSIAYSDDGSMMLTAGFGRAKLWATTSDATMLGEAVLVREIPQVHGDLTRTVASGVSAGFAEIGGQPVAVVADRDLAWTFRLDPFEQTAVDRLPARESFIAQGDLGSPVAVVGSQVVTASVAGSMSIVSIGDRAADTRPRPVPGVERHLHLIGSPLDIDVRAGADKTAIAGTDGIVLLSLRGDGVIAIAADADASGGETAVSFDGQVGAWANGTTYEARLWRFDGPTPHPVPIVHADPFYIFVSPSAERAVALDHQRGALLIDTSDGRVIATLIDDIGDDALPLFSPDGDEVALVDGDGTVTLFDATDGIATRALHELEPFDAGDKTGALRFGLAFDSTGNTLFGFGPRGGSAMWHLDTGEVGTPPPNSGLNTVGILSFSTNGRLAMIADSEGAVRLLDPVTLAPTGVVFASERRGPGNGAALTPDGRYLLATSGGYAQLWDFERQVRIGDVFPADESWVASVSADGRWVTTGRDGRIVRWDLDIEHWDEIACDVAGRNLTPVEWAEFGARDSEYVATCPQYESLADMTEG
jgi:DNA-binding SARP family transcriptional activator/WD40 repeat protein/tRNA A-37 threonylcarbamoyl transferase component Bud32